MLLVRVDFGGEGIGDLSVNIVVGDGGDLGDVLLLYTGVCKV